jgi:hypothetical protein
MSFLEPPMPFGHADQRSWSRDISWPQVRHAYRHATSRMPSRTNEESVVHTGPDMHSNEGHTISVVTDKDRTGVITVWRNEPGVTPEQIQAKEKAQATESIRSKTQTNRNKKDQKAKQLQRAHESHPPNKTCPLCRPK